MLQLGDGTTRPSATPRLVEGDHTWLMISAGNGHSCGVTSELVGKCWG
jgi:hypothetical protein